MRRAFAGEVRQEDDAPRARRASDAASSRSVSVDSTPPSDVRRGTSRTPRPVAAIAPPMLYRPGSGAIVDERSGNAERAVPVHAEPAGRPADVDRIAGLGHARAVEARPRVDDAGHDRDAGPRPSCVRGVAGQVADDLAGSNVLGGTRSARDARGVEGGRDRERLAVAEARRRPRRSCGARGSPTSRDTSGSPPPRLARCRSTQSAAGSPARAQPSSPVARDSSSTARRPSAMSCQMIAGRVGRPAASTATSVGPWPSTAIARTSARSARGDTRDRGRRARPTRRPDPVRRGRWRHRCPSRYPARANPRRRPSRRHETDLDLGRPEVDAEDRGFADRPGSRRRLRVGRARRRPRRCGVRHEDRDRPGPQGAEDRPNLRRAARRRRSGPGHDRAARASNAIVRPRRSPSTNRPPDMSNGAMSSSPTASARIQSPDRHDPERRGTPGRPADPERGDVESVPEVEDPADAVVGVERPSSSPGRRRDPARAVPAARRRSRRRRAGTARGRVR